MSEGFEWSIFEIFEMILAVSLFLTIGSAILFISDPNYAKMQFIGLETTYTTSLISKNDCKVELHYSDIEDIDLSISGNEIVTKIPDKNSFSVLKSYIGDKDISIKKKKNDVTIISNG